MWILTPQNYEKIRRFFPPDSRRLALLRFFYSFVSVPVYCAYPALLLVLYRAQDARFWRVLLVPAAVFVLCTVLRARLNWPRPFDAPGFAPLLPKYPARQTAQNGDGAQNGTAAGSPNGEAAQDTAGTAQKEAAAKMQNADAAQDKKTADGKGGFYGQSFPSRHAASAAVIALAGWYINPSLGGMLTAVCAAICVVRVLAGVHHPRDIAAGLALALAVGGIGFWLV